MSSPPTSESARKDAEPRARAHAAEAARGELGRWILACCGAALLMALASQFEAVWVTPRWGFFLAFAVVALQTLLVACVAPMRRLWLPLGALLLALAFTALRGSAPGAWTGAALTTALLAGGTAIGAALGARIEHAGHLLAVALVSGLADLWSAHAGPTARMVADAISRPERLALFALPWPLWGTGTIQPVLGVGDVVFVALYLATFRRHGLSRVRACVGMGAGFALGLGLLLGLERAVPLLPLLGAGAICADRRARALEKRELVLVVAVTAVLAGLLATRWGR
ncbi:MAG: hypothetical protein QM778_00765 [Myxococcales bacterium]